MSQRLTASRRRTGLPRAAAVDDQLIWKSGASSIITLRASPEIKPGAGKFYNQWNDFDNGVAQSTDGAFIKQTRRGGYRHHHVFVCLFFVGLCRPEYHPDILLSEPARAVCGDARLLSRPG